VWSKSGWDVGATAFVVRWVGITGAFGRHGIENLPTCHVVVGPRFTTRVVGFEYAQ
jgi:hypothetical protein